MASWFVSSRLRRLCTLGSLLCWAFACSEAGSGGAKQTPGAGGAGGTTTQTNSSGGGGQTTMGSNTGGAAGATTTTDSAGASGAGGDNSGPPEVSCSVQQEIEAGQNYGEHSVFAVRMDLDLAAGVYSIRVRSGSDGVAYVFRGDTLLGEFEYDPELPLAGTEQTLAFPGLFELDIRSQTAPDLSTLDRTLFDGCHVITVVEAPNIAAGETYGAILIESLTIDPQAPSGTYTFYAETGNAGVVELRRDQTLVDTLDYAWQTTIGAGASYTFDFPQVVSFTVTRNAGTSNLFVLASEIFDGRHELIVE